jgi:hypothetical protein
VLLALRALVAATPAILVLGAIFFMSRDNDLGAPKDPTECTDDCPTVRMLTPEDEERMHRLALKTETAIDMLDG